MSLSFRIMVFMIVAASVLSSPMKSKSLRKLDDTTPAATNQPNDEVKCGSCPCGTTCYSSPPPPAPSPPPPAPSPPPPSPPPPSPPKKPSPSPGVYCPPPPYSGGGGGSSGGSGKAPPNYIYVSGPPGDIYPVVQSVSAARRSFTVAIPQLMVVVGLIMGMIAFC
ncbi:uncharacterized protein [Rutidosis leptorrhynchoides]|uniref:uncharacterized protein n=1 Tax=Rutidosis leptorrhynchoides TaxID=125765 RepID=UPI003A993B9C